MSIQTKLRGLREVWNFDNRLWLAVTKTLFPGEKLHIYRYKGLEILTDHSGGDANGAREVLVSQMYRRFLAKMDLSGPVNILDLGANNGGFPLLLRSSGVEVNKVVSVEFNPQTFVRLHFNLTRNLDGKVIPLNAAVCGENKTLNVSLGSGGASDSIYGSSNGATSSREYEIEGLSFDEIYRRYFPGEIIDVCKIDVEGAEFEVIQGGNCDELAKCRYLIMEIHENSERKADTLIAKLDELGLRHQPIEPDAEPDVHFFINSNI